MVSHLGNCLDQSWRRLLRAEQMLEVRCSMEREKKGQQDSLARKRRLVRPQTSGGAYYGGILNNRNDPKRCLKRPSLNLSKSPSGRGMDVLSKSPHSPSPFLESSLLSRSYHHEPTRPTSQPPSSLLYPHFSSPKPSLPVNPSRKRANSRGYKTSSACDFSLWSAVAIYMNSGKQGLRTSCPDKLFEREAMRGKRKEVRAVVNMPVFKWIEGGEEEQPL